MQVDRGITRGALVRRGAIAVGGLAAITATDARAQFPTPVEGEPFGVNVQDHGALPDGSTDSSEAFQSAHDAIVDTGGTILVPRGHYVLNTPLKFKRGNAGWVRLVGEGRGATLITPGPDNGQLAQFDKVDDYDTFQKIEIADLTFDADNRLGEGHVILGILPWHLPSSGSVPPQYQSRLHLNNIVIRRVHAHSIDLGLRYRTFGIHLSGAVESSDDSEQIKITDILLEDVQLDGSRTGHILIGTVKSGPLTDGRVNVFFDRIHLVRCSHDTGVVPQSFKAQANFQIGGAGYGGMVRLQDCYGANSADIGLEIDSMNDAVVVGCKMVDSWKNNYLIANFRPPLSIASQRYLYLGCTAQNLNLDPAIGGPDPHHWGLQGDDGTGHYAFGSMQLIGCQSLIDTPLANFSTRGTVVYAARARYREISIRDLDVGVENYAASNGGAEYPSLIDLCPLNAAQVRIDGVHFRLRGSRSGSGRLTLRFIRLGGPALASVENVVVEVLVEGMSTASDSHRVVEIGDSPGSSVQGSVRAIKVGTYSSKADVRGVVIASTSTLAVPTGSTIVATSCDFRGAPAGAGFDYDVHSTQRGRLIVRDIAGQRTSGNSGPPHKAQAVGPGPSPYRFVNTDPIVHDMVVAGGDVSGIDISEDNSAFFATGVKNGVFRIAPGGALRITYSAAPTLTRIPAR